MILENVENAGKISLEHGLLNMVDLCVDHENKTNTFDCKIRHQVVVFELLSYCFKIPIWFEK